MSRTPEALLEDDRFRAPFGSGSDHELLLGAALRGVLIRAGVLSKDSAVKGTELLTAAQTYMESTDNGYDYWSMTIRLEEIVYAINCEIRETIGCEYIYLTHRSDGFCDTIELMGIPIWDSEGDDREYLDEENDVREDIEVHIRRVIKEELVKLAKMIPLIESPSTVQEEPAE